MIWLIGHCAGAANEEERAEQAAVQQKQAAKNRAARAEQAKANWAERGNEILAQIGAMIEKGEYSTAAQEAEKWKGVGGEPVGKLWRRARELDFVATAKKIPAKNVAANRSVYAELVKLAPENDGYQKKLDHYNQIAAAEAEKRRAYTAKNGETPSRSGWTGRSYRAVDTYLAAVANDPDSIEVDNCTDAYRNDEGWVVGCSYRGKNAFGGVVKNAGWFVIHHNRVVTAKPGDAYKW